VVPHALTRALVIVPTYNEVENLASLVAAVFAQPADLSLLIVDDNSPDGTGKLADDLSMAHPDRLAVLHRPDKNGIGPAYVAGFRRALQGDQQMIVTMDADLSHDPDDLPRMLEAAVSADVVIGSRYVDGGSTVGWPLHRRLISKGGGTYARFVLGVPVHDLTSGYKVYRREVIEQFDFNHIRSDGYGFQIETVFRAIKNGFRVVEIPIEFHDRTRGKSKLSRRIVLEAAPMVWKLRFERFQRGAERKT
jgi:dolichol-phosphate mannosyltransferase